jgi:hypothetical protein
MIMTISWSMTAQAELPLNQRYLMYDRNGPTYTYTSSTVGFNSNTQTPTVISGSVMPSAYSVNLPTGSYLVVPNTTTGRVMSVIQTSRGK